jgi:hypothetical protein
MTLVIAAKDAKMITARGGTDAANMALFWPDNLPEDADEMLKADAYSLVETMHNEGKLIQFPCDSDGGYTAAVFVKEEIPADLAAFCKEEEKFPSLKVQGAGYFGGLEYLFKYDSRHFDKYPKMCEKMEIPEGVYSATIYQTDLPDDFYETKLAEQTDRGDRRIWNRQQRCLGFSAAGVVATLIALAFPWIVAASSFAITTVFVVMAFALSRTDAYKRITQMKDELERSYPDYVVRLE